MIRFNKEIDCGYCAGLALAVPIYNEFFSWYVSVILALPLLFFLVRREFVVRKPAEALIPFGLLFLFYGLALLLDPSVYAVYVAKELIIALCLFLIYLVSNEGSLNGFFDAVTPVGFVSALIGLVKAALLDRGYLLGFVLDFCGYYPAGSGLCLNYNNLGLLWLVACLGFLNRGLWCWAPVVIAAGALVGSRRFLILMCFIPVVWFYLRQSFRISRAIIFILSSFLIIDFVSFPDSFERFRFGGEEYKVIFSFGDKGGGAPGGPEGSGFVNINRSTPSAMLGTMSDGALGAASRLDLWAYAWSLVSFKPQGWTYHDKFSCRFSGCAEYVYPHSSILSAWIAGGFIFAVIAVLFYVWPLCSVFSAGSVIARSLLLISMPYSLVSGDTVFSIPICVSAIIVALSSLKSIKLK